MAASVTESRTSPTMEVSLSEAPRPSILQLPSGRVVYMRPITHESVNYVEETFFTANQVGLVILLDREAKFQSMENVNKRFTELTGKQEAEGKEPLKVKTYQAYLGSTGADDVANFSSVLKMAHKNMKEGKNIEIWGPVYDATFLAMSFWLYENYNLPGVDSQNFETVEQALREIEKQGEGLAELSNEERQRLQTFLDAYLQHLKQGEAKPESGWEKFKKKCCCCCVSCPSMKKAWEAFKRNCCCCWAACFPSTFEPPGSSDYNRIPG